MYNNLNFAIGGNNLKYKQFEVNLKDKFDLKTTLECGQCFRFYEENDGSFTVLSGDKLVKVLLNEDKLVFYLSGEEDINYWINFFDLYRNYDNIISDLSFSDNVFSKITFEVSGIRILNQQPWETLCSFIISQNNNIPRIKGIIKRLCENFGERICGLNEYYSFPSADTVSRLNEDDLSILRAGFRTKYIIDAAKKVSVGEVNLEMLKDVDIETARNELMKIHGVGPKVADCTLLYGIHRLEAFPMDVWMKRAMKKLYPGFDSSIFGKFAGIAQQYIFHYSRMHPEIFD